jgi:hypothetical protein
MSGAVPSPIGVRSQPPMAGSGRSRRAPSEEGLAERGARNGSARGGVLRGALTRQSKGRDDYVGEEACHRNCRSPSSGR